MHIHAVELYTHKHSLDTCDDIQVNYADNHVCMYTHSMDYQ